MDIHRSGWLALSAVGTGHLNGIDPPADGVQARQRQVLPLVELRVPFALNRGQIDDVARGSQDPDWQPARDAARQIAFAEDQAIFAGYPAAGIGGIVPGASNPPVILPAGIADYRWRRAGREPAPVSGRGRPVHAVLPAGAYTEVSEASDHGYPVIGHLRNVLDGGLVWAPAIAGAVLVTARGGDFACTWARTCRSATCRTPTLRSRCTLQESFTFHLLTSEAAVSLTASAQAACRLVLAVGRVPQVGARASRARIEQLHFPGQQRPLGDQPPPGVGLLQQPLLHRQVGDDGRRHQVGHQQRLFGRVRTVIWGAAAFGNHLQVGPEGSLDRRHHDRGLGRSSPDVVGQQLDVPRELGPRLTGGQVA